MSMIPARITTRKSSNVNGKVETLESVDTEIEKSLINVIWNGLSETISYVLRQEFSAGIVEYSINELFDDPEEMLAFSKKRLKVARIVMNTIFGRASLLVDDSIIKIPDLNLSYKSPTTSKLTLICFQSGTLLGLANIHLSGKYCITQEDATTISLCGGFEVRELSMLFSDCWVVYDGIENIGNCKLVSCKSKFLLKILLEKKGNKYCPKLDNVQLCWIRQMECDFVGLPCLTNDIRKELQSYVEAFLYGEIQPMMINYFKERFEGVLKKYKIARHIKNIP
nr:uncharacterized protein LOC111422014 [Onthophagus taurus]